MAYHYHTSTKRQEYFVITVTQRSKLAWYLQAQPITVCKKNLITWYSRTISAPTSILRWVETFSNVEDFENSAGREKRLGSNEAVSSQFPIWPASNMGLEERIFICLDFLLCHIDHFDIDLAFGSLHEIKNTSGINTRLCTSWYISRIVYGKHLGRSQFLALDRFFK